jgi:hypothetical protein
VALRVAFTRFYNRLHGGYAFVQLPLGLSANGALQMFKIHHPGRAIFLKSPAFAAALVRADSPAT